jgi:hypothetical protein
MAAHTSVLSDGLDRDVLPWLKLAEDLRALDLDQQLNVPQMCVMGDQSSGKSSVLEALSGDQKYRKWSVACRFHRAFITGSCPLTHAHPITTRRYPISSRNRLGHPLPHPPDHTAIDLHKLAYLHHQYLDAISSSRL